MAMSGFMSKVNFVNKVPLLMRATSSDQTPTAGHIYEEISCITYESIEQCDVLVEFLTERLKKASPYIKLKVLLIMKAVVQKGHVEFGRSLSKQAQGIRDAKSFNGPSDPLLGDSPYVNVREAAGQLLQLLFDTDRVKSVSNSYESTWNKKNEKMEGFGSSNFGGIQKSNSSSSGSLKSQETNGFGFAVQRIKDNMSYVFNENVNALAKYQQNGKDSSRGYQQFKDSDRKIVNKPSHTFNLLGNASSGNENDFPRLSESDRSSAWERPTFSSFPDSSLPSMSSQASIEGLCDDEASENWSKEISLIDKITTPGGVRLNPGKSELNEFTKKCETLDFEKIIELIDGKLENADYRVQMKSLFLIENLLNSNVPNARELISRDLMDSLQKLMTSDQTAVKNKTTKLLHILGPKPVTITSNQNQGKSTESSSESLLVNLPSEDNTQSNIKTKVEHPHPSLVSCGNDLVSLMNDVSMQGTVSTDKATAQNSLIDDLLGSNVMVGQRPESNTIQGSNSKDLLDLNFLNVREYETSKSNSPTVPQSLLTADLPSAKDICVTTAAQQKKIADMNFDPFFNRDGNINVNVDNLESNKSCFDFLAQGNTTDLIQNDNNHEMLSQIRPVDAINTVNRQDTSLNTKKLPQCQNFPLAMNYQNQNNGISSANINSTNQHIIRPYGLSMDRRSMAISSAARQEAPSKSNGFDFIGKNKKPGAFDFVREAMEASKKK